MTTEVKKLEGLTRQISFEVSSEALEAKVQSDLKRMAKKVKVQGFRPGKAPLSVVDRMHGQSVRYEALNRLIGESLDKELSQIDERVAGVPDIAPDTEKAADGRLAFIATFEVYPVVEAPDFSTLELKRYVCEVTDEDVEKTLDVLKKQRMEYEIDATRPAQKGDRVTIDFVGKIDGVEFPGGQAKGFPFFVGQGQMLPEFEAAVEGMKAGETKTFPLSFPEDYHGKEVAGKTAEFTITVNEVAMTKLPELDSEFAKSLGQVDGDVQKLIEAVRENVTREVSFRVNNRTKMGVMDMLSSLATFDLPQTVINREVEERKAMAMQDLQGQDIPKEEFESELFIAEATRRLKLGFLLSEIVKRDEIVVKDEEIRAHIQEIAKSYEKPEEVVEHYMKDKRLSAEITAVVLEDKVMDHILSKAKTVEEAVPFDVVMGGA